MSSATVHKVTEENKNNPGLMVRSFWNAICSIHQNRNVIDLAIPFLEFILRR